MKKKVKIIAIGECNDPPDSCLPENTIWVVYDYQSGDYDGSGSAYCGTSDGKYYETTLGHCSCYGAWDENDHCLSDRKWNEIPKEDLVGMHLSGDDETTKKFKEAIFPLIGKRIKKNKEQK